MRFTLRLHGQFQLLSPAGENIVIASRKHQALIAMLALSNGKPISRSKLAGLLWAERTEEHARNSLRQAFFTIRHAVDGHGVSPFVFDSASGWARRDAVATDIHTLVESAGAGRLPSALDAFDGEFLEGLVFHDETLEAWLVIERSRHHNLLVDCLAGLADKLERAGDVEQACLAARCLLRRDPYHEPSHRTILRFHQTRGERARALKHYESLKALLDANLGVAPDQETQQLIDRIREPRPLPPEVANGKPRIAILPIRSLSHGGDDKLTAETLTRKLIGELGLFSPLSVIAAATMLALDARHETVEDIGQRVGADYVLETAVQGQGETGWALAQLISVQSGTQIWSRKYTGENLESAAGQDRLVRKISGNLYHILMRHAAASSAMEPEGGIGTEKLYLQVFHHVERPTLKGMIRARRLCERLLAIDPNHVLVRESLAWINFHSCFNGWLDDPDRGFREAHEIVLAGLALDDHEPYLLSAFGLAEIYLGNARAGLDALKRAVDLNPNDAEFHTWLGIGLTFSGAIGEAHLAFDQADQVSPDYHPIFLFRADAHYTSGNYEDAITCLDRFLTVLPEYNWGRLLRGACYQALDSNAMARRDVAHVGENALLLNGRYLDQLLQARTASFRQGLWQKLEAAGFPG
ncbi:hypothetical protein A6U87_03510 [Rhizobium sp. AC44/96]|uniref:BTAD domain-containing putative transcriptional regulator n=1 Tax=Rhizobium sp. AC44/96 TaxID=1841654 RepID=UPI00080FE518|nr:BTAD domain-containing putative transcriptional regulator [Rhizobium sp. AC44/96]OCJ17993.1 hypothetical protein A6U87_03510 [Rhizobium sp. AC44/96]